MPSKLHWDEKEVQQIRLWFLSLKRYSFYPVEYIETKKYQRSQNYRRSSVCLNTDIICLNHRDTGNISAYLCTNP